MILEITDQSFHHSGPIASRVQFTRVPPLPLSQCSYFPHSHIMINIHKPNIHQPYKTHKHTHTIFDLQYIMIYHNLQNHFWMFADNTKSTKEVCMKQQRLRNIRYTYIRYSSGRTNGSRNLSLENVKSCSGKRFTETRRRAPCLGKQNTSRTVKRTWGLIPCQTCHQNNEWEGSCDELSFDMRQNCPQVLDQWDVEEDMKDVRAFDPNWNMLRQPGHITWVTKNCRKWSRGM